MINVYCDHCKERIHNARTEIEKNFFQIIGDDGKVECDLCKVCYKEWCTGLDSINKSIEITRSQSEKVFKHTFIKGRKHD